MYISHVTLHVQVRKPWFNRQIPGYGVFKYILQCNCYLSFNTNHICFRGDGLDDCRAHKIPMNFNPHQHLHPQQMWTNHQDMMMNDYRNDHNMEMKMLDDFRHNMTLAPVKNEPMVPPHFLCGPPLDHPHRLHHPISSVWYSNQNWKMCSIFCLFNSMSFVTLNIVFQKFYKVC